MTVSAAGAAPIEQAERVLLLDVLRGFALLGILLMNIEAFSTPFARAISGIDPTLSGIDRWVDAATLVLVQGKFYPLFSLLFGAGFAMMMARGERRGGAGGLFVRRMLVLLAIGLLHYLYVWSGDILLVYASCGLVLLVFFRHAATARLPGWGLLLFALPLVLTLAFGTLGELSRLDPGHHADMQAALVAQQDELLALDAAQQAAYGPDGSYAAANAQRRAEFAWSLDFLVYMFAPSVLGLFVLGAWLMRSGVLQRPEAHAAFFRRWRLRGFGVGLPLVLYGVWRVPTQDFGRLDLDSAVATVSGEIGGVLLCLGYLSAIALSMQAPGGAARWTLLAPAGRMALSHYLLQSIVCTLVFYGYGLGYYGALPRAWQVPFALLLFVAQVALSHWWLARFRFGPAEWLWRSLTYLRWQPMRLAG